MDQSGALYLAIADQLRQQIVNGELAPGAALPSQTEIARQFGVSDGVARKVIRTLVVIPVDRYQVIYGTAIDEIP
ncbi:winged helix-turn-helix domain-containing protein [Streptosporangium sp. NPDC000239]|uniref:winged helix-turn-helix domain-containing protein n=1 Tax=Streptosporangium sp. NPDC000239 TaxID=3154248 RepID=UPI0033236D35